MGTPMVMITVPTNTTGMTETRTWDAGLLQVLWMASPALPVGGFSYSEGLEAAVDAGLVADESTAAPWLIDQLHLGLARCELPLVSQALAAWKANDLPRVQALNRWMLETRESHEFRLQTEQMGRSLQEWARTLGDTLGETGQTVSSRLAAARLEPPTYPVAYACALACSPADQRQALLGFAFGWAENLVQAAIKSIPLGQSAGQRILARMTREIPVAVDHALSLDDSHRQAFTPMLAILSARHETQYSRLFRS